MLSDPATRPLASWQALQTAMTTAGTNGAAALDAATVTADGTTDALDDAGSAAGGAGGVIVRARLEFDVSVRFDSDMLDVTLDIERLGSIRSIPLLELRR